MKPLRVTAALIPIALLWCMLFSSCKTSQQQVTFNALQTVETTADVGYSNYVSLVIKGTLSTNFLPQVSQVYNDLHKAIILAATVNANGTNALVPENVTIELGQLLNLIQTASATIH